MSARHSIRGEIDLAPGTMWAGGRSPRFRFTGHAGFSTLAFD
jgi:hypothetical protein